MLTLLEIGSSRDQEIVFGSFDPNQATWLVSDLKSKLDLNRRLLIEREFVPGTATMRASELWRLMLGRARPDLQLISREFALTLISEKLTSGGPDWAQGPGAASTAMDYMTQLMPLLAHPNGDEMMRSWFEQNPSSHARWGRWYELADQLWKDFLNSGFTASHWASGVLVNEPGLNEFWLRPLYVDLGAELNQVEADLLIQLSEAIDIFVLKPAPSWADQYPKTLIPYELFERKLKVSKKKIASGERSKTSAKKIYRNYTTMIAEVKAAVAQARLWLDGDHDLHPRDLAIVAPDIESYWPALSSYLQEEGLPCQKDHVRRMHAYPDVARFFANLRLKTGSFNEADIELSLFDPAADQLGAHKGSHKENESTRLLSYDRFKTLYSTLYSREDLNRATVVAKRFSIELSLSELISRDDFVAWSLRQLPAEAELERVESLYKRLFSEVPPTMALHLKKWLSYLECLASQVECRVRDGDPMGIACLRLTSADSSPAKKMILLGLTESALKTGGGTAVLLSDILSLGQQYGFHLASEDQGKAEFEARWVAENDDRELILSVPETDFNGAALAPSWLWVRGSRETAKATGEQNNHLSVPDETRWDELQKAGIGEIASARQWSSAQRIYLERTFQEDLGEKPFEPFGHDLVTRVSPSGIEDYLNCPFVFAAKRLIGLSDVAELDLEIDASRRGSLMHKLFELLTVEPMRFDLSRAELEEIVESARSGSNLELADDRLWPSLKAKHIDLAKHFLDFERELRRSAPEAKVLAREVDIAGYVRPSTGELIRDPEPGALAFIGRIDRLDTDERGNFAIYDYKSSASTTSQYTSWCKNNRIQLLLYAIAVEGGLTKYERAPVLSAMYYVARPLSRDAGFKVEGVDQGLYDLSDKRRNRLSHDEKQVLFNEAKAMVKTALEGIQAGRFDPSPRDRRDCPNCLWSAVCRAPHLSS